MKHFCFLAAIALSSTAVCLADLNEEGFEKYREGELLGQHEWRPQTPGEKGYANMRDLAEIRVDPDKGGRWLVWKAGFESPRQTRILKRFPQTAGTKVVVKLDVIPGNETVSGQFIFDQNRTGGTSLRFVKGTLRIAEFGDPKPKDTGVPFLPQAWNRLELQFDFETHSVRVFSEGRDAGAYALPPTLTGLNEINFFAGGADFETALDNLSIESVDAFSAPEAK